MKRDSLAFNRAYSKSEANAWAEGHLDTKEAMKGYANRRYNEALELAARIAENYLGKGVSLTLDTVAQKIRQRKVKK